MTSQQPWRHPAEPGVLSVVVPCHSADYGLERCLEALMALRPPPSGLQILVANHGSKPEVSQLCSRYGIEDVLVEEGGGSYKARNVALFHARGEWIGFTDSNKFPDPDWALRGAQVLGASRDTIVAGPVRTIPHPDRGEDEAYLLQLYQAFPIRRYVREAGYGVTGNLFVPRTIFDRVGLFDGQTASGGDREFCMRARARGIDVVYDDSLVVRHLARSEAELRLKRSRTFAGIVRTWANEGRDPRKSWSWAALAKCWLLPPRRIADNPIPERWRGISVRWTVLRKVLLERYLQGWRILRLKITGNVPEGTWY